MLPLDSLDQRSFDLIQVASLDAEEEELKLDRLGHSAAEFETTVEVVFCGRHVATHPGGPCGKNANLGVLGPDGQTNREPGTGLIGTVGRQCIPACLPLVPDVPNA